MRGRWLFLIAVALALCAGGAVGRGGLGRYGGSMDMELPATGWFRIQKVSGRWWLVDPDGHPFLSAGVEGVNVPAAGDPYRAAVARKYGSTRRWAERTVQRLRGWGFNTLGVGADDRACRQGMPYLLLLDLSGRLREPPPEGLVDVFSPSFEKQAGHAARRLCRRDDPLLIGYLTDEGFPWQREGEPYQAVLEEYLGLDDLAPGRSALLDFLESRYLSIDELNEAWHSDYRAFSEIGRVPQVGASVPEEDSLGFLRLVADRYFEVATRAVRSADHNHLVLGCRLASAPPPAVLETMRGRVDIAVVAGYGERPPSAVLRQIYRTTQRPVLVAGFSFRARDSGLPNTHGRGPLVDTQEERAESFTRYVEELLSLPMVVGYHWYRHADSPATGGPAGENSNCGLVTVEDEPYEPLASAVLQANQGLYAQLAAGAPRLKGGVGLLPVSGR